MSRGLIPYKRMNEVQPVGPEPNSLEAKIKAKLAKFKPQPEISGDFALLLDCTGSMWGQKIQKLRESVRAFPKVRKFAYSDMCVELKGDAEAPEPMGNNNEELAFRTLKTAGVGHIVMITDGWPDRPEQALQVAKETGLKIDIIYIGPPPPPEFLQRLASQCGGSFDPHVEFDKLYGAKQLEAKIKGLLPPPEAEAKPSGAICL